MSPDALGTQVLWMIICGSFIDAWGIRKTGACERLRSTIDTVHGQHAIGRQIISSTLEVLTADERASDANRTIACCLNTHLVRTRGVTKAHHPVQLITRLV